MSGFTGAGRRCACGELELLDDVERVLGVGMSHTAAACLAADTELRGVTVSFSVVDEWTGPALEYREAVELLRRKLERPLEDELQEQEPQLGRRELELEQDSYAWPAAVRGSFAAELGLELEACIRRHPAGGSSDTPKTRHADLARGAQQLAADLGFELEPWQLAALERFLERRRP